VRSSGITPASRLLFWIKAAFVGDAALAAFGGILLAIGDEAAAFPVFAFAAVRALLGVIALLLAARALERRHPNDDAPSSIR
jgi:membrane protein implicated in regulation of membrane protease activity